MEVMGLDIPTQSSGGRRRALDLHLALVAEKKVVNGHAQWWHFEMKEKFDAQSKKNPSAPFINDGGGSASVAEESSRVPRQKLTEVEQRAHARVVRKAKEGELDT